MASPHPHFRADPARLAGAGTTTALHALLAAFLAFHAPARDVLKTPEPLMVQLIKPGMPAPAVSKPQAKLDSLPKPSSVKRLLSVPDPETPLLPAQAQVASVPAMTAPPDPRLLPVEARSAPPAPPAPPAAIVPPSFNANYLDNPAPAYPPLARRLGEEGRVTLRVHVEASGLPSQVEVRISSGSERLDQAALEAVKRWKFVPAKQGDVAVPASVVVPISFSLKG